VSSGYPQFSPAARKGESGIQAVSRIINDFTWILRRNHQETDFGIDGHVDLVTDDGRVTGQQFAFQVKYGKSFFQRKTRWGYIYRGDIKHFNYMSNYPCPILIIICHPESGKCYWSIFDPSQTQGVEKGWTMTIPFNNDLSLSKDVITNLFLPLVDAASLIEAQWTLHEIAISSDYIAYFVDRSEVDSLQVDHLRKFFDRIQATKELAHHCMGKVEIVFHGYDDDPRELYQISQIRRYISIVDPLIPELFFFARTEEPTFTLIVFALSLSKIDFPTGIELTGDHKIKVEFDPKDLQGFLKNHFIGLNQITEWLDLSEEDNKRITYSVMRRILPDFQQ
jgi:hypothetical protein